MKKTSETPTLKTEAFDTEDVITTSGVPIVGNNMEVPLGNIINNLLGRDNP